MPSLQLSNPISSSPAEQGKTPAELGLAIGLLNFDQNCFLIVRLERIFGLRGLSLR